MSEVDINLEEMLAKLGDTPKPYDCGRPKRKYRKRKACQFPSCGVPSKHTHHLTYSPEVTTRLCKAHHEDITIVNCNAAHKVSRKLTNWERIALWMGWIDGKLKPEATPE